MRSDVIVKHWGWVRCSDLYSTGIEAQVSVVSKPVTPKLFAWTTTTSPFIISGVNDNMPELKHCLVLSLSEVEHTCRCWNCKATYICHQLAVSLADSIRRKVEKKTDYFGRSKFVPGILFSQYIW